MKKPTLRYQEAPILRVAYSCSGWHCHSPLEFEEGYLCPSCGTQFDVPEEQGTPYEEWSGEETGRLPLYGDYGERIDLGVNGAITKDSTLRERLDSLFGYDPNPSEEEKTE